MRSQATQQGLKSFSKAVGTDAYRDRVHVARLCWKATWLGAERKSGLQSNEVGRYRRVKVGTPYYMSPETCSMGLHSFAGDVWAMGCVGPADFCAACWLFPRFLSKPGALRAVSPEAPIPCAFAEPKIEIYLIYPIHVPFQLQGDTLDELMAEITRRAGQVSEAEHGLTDAEGFWRQNCWFSTSGFRSAGVALLSHEGKLPHGFRSRIRPSWPRSMQPSCSLLGVNMCKQSRASLP